MTIICFGWERRSSERRESRDGTGPSLRCASLRKRTIISPNPVLTCVQNGPRCLLRIIKANNRSLATIEQRWRLGCTRKLLARNTILRSLTAVIIAASTAAMQTTLRSNKSLRHSFDRGNSARERIIWRIFRIRSLKDTQRQRRLLPKVGGRIICP